MTEHELRALVREAIAQQLARPRPGAEPLSSDGGAPGQPGAGDRGRIVAFSRFGVPSGPDGTCVIEPAVMCNHCGYCKSYGH